MPLQNRVTPFGALVAVEGRGLLMGNRGRLHDAERRIVRYAQGRRWIACLTRFRGRRRTVMSPGRYTELFFLDEAVALAAGHRPCAECRRDDYVRFRAAWAGAVSNDLSADGMDKRLDADRLAGPGTRRTYRDASSAVPDGAFVDIDGAAWLVWRGDLRAWTPEGYAERREPVDGLVTVITPRAIVDVIRAGYRPGVHPSAEAGAVPAAPAHAAVAPQAQPLLRRAGARCICTNAPAPPDRAPTPTRWHSDRSPRGA